MECKVVSCFLQMLPPHCINRNIMECKVIFSIYIPSINVVLIETLWNVKYKGTITDCVLNNGINRNIMECKARSTTACLEYIFVLIETLWNVKENY